MNKFDTIRETLVSRSIFLFLSAPIPKRPPDWEFVNSSFKVNVVGPDSFIPFFCFVPVIIIYFSAFITFYNIQLVIGFSTLSINRGIVPWSRAWSNWCSRTRCLLYWCRSTMLIFHKSPQLGQQTNQFF